MSHWKWQTRLSQEMISHYTALGKWPGLTLADAAATQLRDRPNKIAVIDSESRLSFAQLHQKAARLAQSLQMMGLRAGDVISFQLPNWHEAMVINLAASMANFVCNPIVPIYRDAELSFILNDAQSKAIFLPDTFRGFDYAQMITRLRSDLSNLAHVISVRANFEGAIAFDELTGEGLSGDFEPAGEANDLKLLLYTSGTTGKAKGVLHSHNTLRAEIDAVTEYWRVTDDDVILMASPVTHITGYLYALELPFACGGTAVLMTQWDCAEAVQLINTHRATLSIGATPFLAELTSEVERSKQTVPSLRLFACGGAPVPPELIFRAEAALPSCITCRVYGSSEAPTVSLGVNTLGQVHRAATTDGFIYNHEVKIVDPVDSTPLEVGRSGEILTRGPEVMLGYTDAEETRAAFDEDGFFRTGDLGVVDPDGFLTISGRKKDLIIRGGENISPKEIEDALYEHPCIQEVAVVAMPHPRMGETPAAFVVPTEGARFTFDDMVEFLEDRKITKQKFPEQLVLIDNLPRNVAGKIQKNILRDMLTN